MPDRPGVSMKLLDSLSPRTRNGILRAMHRQGKVPHIPEGYTREADGLQKAYDKAIGYALQYRIPVHRKGALKALGDLRDDIKRHERENGIKDGLFPPPKDSPALIYCGTNAAHKQHVWHAQGRALNCPGKDYR